MTLEPTTCSVVSGANLREFVAAHPDFASHLILKLIRGCARRPRASRAWPSRTSTARVSASSTTSPIRRGRPPRVRERLTQQDIADRIGASREMVSRIFKDLTAGGYLGCRGGRIVIAQEAAGSLVTPARASRA